MYYKDALYLVYRILLRLLEKKGEKTSLYSIEISSEMLIGQ